MTHYSEGALISHELHDMMYESAAEARFDAELSRYEDNYDLMQRAYGSKLHARKLKKESR